MLGFWLLNLEQKRFLDSQKLFIFYFSLYFIFNVKTMYEDKPKRFNNYHLSTFAWKHCWLSVNSIIFNTICNLVSNRFALGFENVCIKLEAFLDFKNCHLIFVIGFERFTSESNKIAFKFKARISIQNSKFLDQISGMRMKAK